MFLATVQSSLGRTEQKRKQRAAMNGQQVRRNNEERRNKRAADTLAKQRQAQTMLQATVMTHTASSTRTPEARRQSIRRVRKCIPKHADSYGDTIEDLITKVTPWKKTALEEHNLLSSTDQKEHAAVGVHVQTAIQDLSNKKDSGSREVRSAYLRFLNKYGSMRHQSNCFAMNRKTLALSRKAKGR